MLSTTYHTYPILIHRGGRLRLARCNWENCTPSQAIAATLAMDPEAVIVAVRQQDGISPLIVGLMPGGIGTI